MQATSRSSRAKAAAQSSNKLASTRSEGSTKAESEGAPGALTIAADPSSSTLEANTSKDPNVAPSADDNLPPSCHAKAKATAAAAAEQSGVGEIPADDLGIAGPTSVQKSIEVATTSMDVATSMLRETSASDVVGGLNALKAAAKAGRSQLHGATSGVKSGAMRAALRGRLAKRRLLPWRWGERAGASVIVQLGASARMPLRPARLVRRVGSKQSVEAPASEDSGGAASLARSLLAPIAPVLNSVRAQPIARVRAEATLGRFRRWALDHASVSAELEGALQHPAALGLWDLGPRPGERTGLTHLASLSLKQQVLGPVRAFADLRWELSADGGADGRGPRGQRAPSPAFGSAAACHVANLRPHAMDRVFGVDWVAGPASVAAWLSPLRKQGLVELRL
jgi:hypothetical protein